MTLRPARSLALLLAAGLALTACAEADEGPSPAPETDAAPSTAAEDVALPEVDGEFGDAPAFGFDDTEPPEGLQVEVLSEGDGEQVEEGAVVVAHYAGIVWGEQETFDDSYSRGEPSMFSLNSVVQGWTQGIPGHPVGSRLLLSIPNDLGYGPQGGNPNAGIGAEDTIVFVVDVVDAFGRGATGEADAAEVTPAADLPVEIAGGLGEPASVTVPEDAAEPQELDSIVIAEGSGEAVATGQSVAIGYATTAWDGTAAGSSWPLEGTGGDGPYAGFVGSGSIVDALVEVPVGSRVLVLTPASEQGPAYAHVVDVLAAR
ncbi:FKBP-type peptidyl-prolyl cis-trans isomerase [Ruania suaedae]|uniref:FKBP-type peptidyl-prolyl cis-trans isomerase n=1 Tax=Ruania suaedae TaxID=2897774 RepID=UPI001E5F7097|nr:FKBP-type peptidyl-prolyl cis-trans isomerase [Ruania suaedae]UFU01647.1 FKBP-type peptidyl-prolyl cis-trans isomerase [Ruania suaedae]